MKNLTFILCAILGFTSLSGCSDIPTGEPELRRQKIYGLRAKTNVMIGKNKKPYWIQQAVSGFSPTSRSKGIPAQIKPLTVFYGCSLSKPPKNVQIEHVQISCSDQRAPIYSISRKAVEKRVDKYLERQRKKKSKYRTFLPYSIDADNYEVVDVVITKTGKPLYLVLGSTTKILWNIHAAPGVKIDRVVLMSQSDVGIANIDPKVPVVTMNRNVTNMCGIKMIKKPDPRWGLYRNKVQEAIDSVENAYWNYVQTFEHMFGVNIDETGTIGLVKNSHVLVGELPKERIPYNSLQNSTVYLSNQDYLFAGNKTLYRQKIKAIANKVLARKQSGS